MPCFHGLFLSSIAREEERSFDCAKESLAIRRIVNLRRFSKGNTAMQQFNGAVQLILINLLIYNVIMK